MVGLFPPFFPWKRKNTDREENAVSPKTENPTKWSPQFELFIASLLWLDGFGSLVPVSRSVPPKKRNLNVEEGLGEEAAMMAVRSLKMARKLNSPLDSFPFF